MGREKSTGKSKYIKKIGDQTLKIVWKLKEKNHTIIYKCSKQLWNRHVGIKYTKRHKMFGKSEKCRHLKCVWT